MNAKRITRREALAASAAAVLFANVGANAAPVPKIDPKAPWIGSTVLPKKYAARGQVIVDPATNEEGSITLDGASFDVKGEKGTRVEVLRPEGGEVWLEKEDVVRLPDAIEFFTKALKENNKDTFALVSRGWAQHLLGKPEKAIEDFDAFLKLTPADMPVMPGTPARWEGLVNRGLVYAEQGEFKKALADLDEALKGWPTLGIARVNRGYTLELMGEYAKALEEYQKTSHVLAGNNIAWVLATCPDKLIRNGSEALRLAKIVCERTANREGMYLDTLAAAYAEAGKFDEAVKAQEKALEDKSYVIRYGEDGQKRLKLYQNKKPFRTEPVKK